jgi:hypothetical protein
MMFVIQAKESECQVQDHKSKVALSFQRLKVDRILLGLGVGLLIMQVIR